MSFPSAHPFFSAFSRCVTSFVPKDPSQANKPSTTDAPQQSSCDTAIQSLKMLPDTIQYFHKVTIQPQPSEPARTYPVLAKTDFLCLLYLHKLDEKQALEVCLKYNTKK